MNEKELKEYQNKMMSGAKGTIGLGVVTGVGSNVLGQVGTSAPKAAPAMGAANSALNLANVGNLAAVGMSIMPGTSKDKPSKPSKKKLMDDPSSFF